MMKRLILKLSIIATIIMTFCVFSLSGKDNKEDKKVITRTIKIDKNFSGLKTQSALEITYTQNNNAPLAAITGPAYIIEGMTWEVNSNGILSFKYPKIKNITGKVTIMLNGGLLNNYEANSSGIIRVTTEVKSNKILNFSVSSSGKIIMQDKVDSGKEVINIAASSSGEIIFNSRATSGVANLSASSSAIIKLPSLSSSPLNYVGSSMGILELKQLTSTVANISLSSGGEFSNSESTLGTLNLQASSGGDASFGNLTAKSINIDVSSGATVKMSGKCTDANLAASSAGDINAKGMKIDKINNRKTSSGGSINI